MTPRETIHRNEIRNETLRRIWTIVARLLVAGVFAQAIFAGVLLSGESWGRTAHGVNANLLIGATLIAGLIAAATLRRIPQGRRLGLTLLALAVVLFLQAALGRASAEGAKVMWIHIPLGVALVGFTAQTVVASRRLGQE